MVTSLKIFARLISASFVLFVCSTASAEPIFESFTVNDAQNSEIARGYAFSYDAVDNLTVNGLGMFDLDDLGIPGTVGSDGFRVQLYKVGGAGGGISIATAVREVTLNSGTDLDAANAGEVFRDNSATLMNYTSTQGGVAVGPVFYEAITPYDLVQGGIYQLVVRFGDVAAANIGSDNSYWANPVSLTVDSRFTIRDNGSGFTGSGAATLTGAGANWGRRGVDPTALGTTSPNEVIGPTLVFGSTAAPEPPVTGVPEPSSMALFLLAAVGGVLRYRKK